VFVPGFDAELTTPGVLGQEGAVELIEDAEFGGHVRDGPAFLQGFENAALDEGKGAFGERAIRGLMPNLQGVGVFGGAEVLGSVGMVTGIIAAEGGCAGVE